MNQSFFKFTLGFLLALTPSLCYGFEIVYPKSNNVTINSDKTFFIGGVKENDSQTLFINEQKVPIYKTGAFKYIVNLEEGENKFVISDNIQTQIYTIYRPKFNSAPIPAAEYEIFDSPTIISTNTDDALLRNSPSEDSWARLGTISKDTKLKVLGQYGQYYKIQLAQDDYAWILKKFTQKTSDQEMIGTKILSYTYSETKNKRIYKLKLNQKTPYIINQNHGYDIVLYNMEDFEYGRYEFHINSEPVPFGYKVFYNSDNELNIEVKKFPKTDSNQNLKNIKITIDPGHGGEEYGAIGCLGEKEKDLNLEISNKLKNELVKQGATVFITRETDKDLGLYERVEFTNKNDSDLFISIHSNALPDTLANVDKKGTEVYYFYPDSKNFAKHILESIVKNTKTENSGIHKQSFAVIRNHQCPCVLVEVGYIINPEDEEKLINQDFQQNVAKSIVEGVKNYLNDVQ